MKHLLRFLALTLFAFCAHAYQLYTPAGVMDVNYANTEGVKATYSAVAADLAPVALATDIVVIKASPTKTVRVTSVRVSGDAQGNNTIDVYLWKRTALNTGGTTSTLAIAKHDSTDGTATAVLTTYSANATSLGAGALLRANHLALPATSNPTIPVTTVEWTGNGRPVKSFVLRAGTTESLAVALSGGSVPTGTQLYVSIEWTEE